MFGQPKPFASLSSGLLARKGQARPAMRPQGFGGFGAPTEAMDDLGWNDMGEGAQTPAPTPEPASVPPVLRQREALEQEFASEPAALERPEAVAGPAAAPEPAAPAPARMVRAAIAKGPKAAFTLRLDAERHLRLRLASATQNRSAQLLVTQALDRFLATLPEVEELARHVADQPGKDVSGETR